MVTQKAGFVYDLRSAWATLAIACPGSAGEGSEVEPDPASTHGDGGPVPSSSLPAEDGDVANPRIKQLSDEAARYRVSAKAEKERADAAESKASELEERLNDQLIRGAFLLASQGRVTDSEAAWKLADMSAVQVGEDGTVTGMEAAIATVVKQYPYLAPEDPDTVDDTTKALRQRFPALEPSGRPTNARRQGADPVNVTALERKFPALRNRR